MIIKVYTVMCLSIGTPKTINFPFVPNQKIYYFRCPKIWAHYSLIVTCLNIETPNNHHFPVGTNGKIVVLGVPILKHFRVLTNTTLSERHEDTVSRGLDTAFHF